MVDEFPSFKKSERKIKESRSSSIGQLLLMGAGVLLLGLFIFLSFRFLVGAKTPRNEMMGKIASSSQIGQSSLLLEWMQNIDQNPIWKPSSQEQMELIRFAHSHMSDLQQDVKSPALYAIHVASWGPGISDKKELGELLQASLTEEARVALFLYLIRQKDFSAEAKAFDALSAAASETYRKLHAAYMERCVEFAGESTIGLSAQNCATELVTALGDNSDEVRWNAALGIMRLKLKNLSLFKDSGIEAASSELDKLYSLLKNGDTTLLSRFQGDALESLAGEVFKVKYALNPAQMKEELGQISSQHPDLRVRNIARSILRSAKTK